jgi:hypothetical protein
MTVPTPILAACVLLILLFGYFLARMLREQTSTGRALGALAKELRAAASRGGSGQRTGLSAEQLERLRARCDQLQQPVRTWWLRVEDNLLSYTGPDRRQSWYLGLPAREVLPEESVSERYYHSSFYQAVPGILTGLGLLTTFVAILLALTALHVTEANDTEVVTGIKGLIEGLSGKFLSSIVGLLLSISFVVIERKWCERRLANAYEDLLDATTHAIPVISAARVQADMQSLALRQMTILSEIRAEMAEFRSMVTAANDAVPQMASALATDVEQFSDKLGELNLALEHGIRYLRQ